MKLQDAVASIQKRLDDEDATVWTNAELSLYVKDGYDLFCQRTKMLFDIHVVENVPQVGNWNTDLEHYLAEQSSGMGLTDEKLNFTGEFERNLGVGGAVGGSLEGPTPATSPNEGAQFDQFSLPTVVATSRLPNTIVDIIRVTWDDIEIPPEEAATMRELDQQYERREGGDPRHYVFSKDGLHTIRFVPPARGDADYATVSGSWGTMTYTDDTAVTVAGGVDNATQHGTLGAMVYFGVLREIEGAFPAGGPHGTPTRQHPDAKNIKVEISRLGRLLDRHEFEIPNAFIKYVIFWAMNRALKRDGNGQDLKLASHFAARFEMGVQKANIRLRKIQREKVLRLGFGTTGRESFGMGDPMLPPNYGPATGREI